MLFHRKKMEVKAIQWTGKNLEEIKEFIKGRNIEILNIDPVFATMIIDDNEWEETFELFVGDYLIMSLGRNTTFYTMKGSKFEYDFEEAE